MSSVTLWMKMGRRRRGGGELDAFGKSKIGDVACIVNCTFNQQCDRPLSSKRAMTRILGMLFFSTELVKIKCVGCLCESHHFRVRDRTETFKAMSKILNWTGKYSTLTPG